MGEYDEDVARRVQEARDERTRIENQRINYADFDGVGSLKGGKK